MFFSLDGAEKHRFFSPAHTEATASGRWGNMSYETCHCFRIAYCPCEGWYTVNGAQTVIMASRKVTRKWCVLRRARSHPARGSPLRRQNRDEITPYGGRNYSPSCSNTPEITLLDADQLKWCFISGDFLGSRLMNRGAVPLGSAVPWKTTADKLYIFGRMIYHHTHTVTSLSGLCLPFFKRVPETIWSRRSRWDARSDGFWKWLRSSWRGRRFFFFFFLSFISLPLHLFFFSFGRIEKGQLGVKEKKDIITDWMERASESECVLVASGGREGKW